MPNKYPGIFPFSPFIYFVSIYLPFFFLSIIWHLPSTGGILRWKIDFAEMEIAAEMDNQDFDDGFI
jgi:hypothetical protein